MPKVIPIDQLIEDEKNARRRTDRNRAALGTSFETYGAARSIVVDKDGVVVAGNGTLEAAKAAGITEVIVLEGEPGKLYAVQRADWDEEQARGYSVMDNKSAELAEWDYRVLDELFTNSEAPPEEFGFLPAEVDALQANVAWTGEEGADVALGKPASKPFSAVQFQVTVLDEDQAETVQKRLEELGEGVVVERL